MKLEQNKKILVFLFSQQIKPNLQIFSFPARILDVAVNRAKLKMNQFGLIYRKTAWLWLHKQMHLKHYKINAFLFDSQIRNVSDFWF